MKNHILVFLVEDLHTFDDNIQIKNSKAERFMTQKQNILDKNIIVVYFFLEGQGEGGGRGMGGTIGKRLQNVRFSEHSFFGLKEVDWRGWIGGFNLRIML